VLASRRRKMVSIDEGHAVDPKFVTNAEYQLFLDEVPQGVSRYTPDHWSEARFSKGEGPRPVATSRRSHVEALCEWMTAKYGSVSWKFMVPSAQQLRDVPLADPEQKNAQDEIGCWTKEGLLGGEHNIAKLRTAANTTLQSLLGDLEAAASVKVISIALLIQFLEDTPTFVDNIAGDLARDPPCAIDLPDKPVYLGSDNASDFDIARARSTDLDLA